LAPVRVAPSKQLTRLLGPIVATTADLLAIDGANLIHHRGISVEPDRHELTRWGIFRNPLEKRQRRNSVTLHREVRLENLALMDIKLARVGKP
jgi:hypothetical protein